MLAQTPKKQKHNPKRQKAGTTHYSRAAVDVGADGAVGHEEEGRARTDVEGAGDGPGEEALGALLWVVLVGWVWGVCGWDG